MAYTRKKTFRKKRTTRKRPGGMYRRRTYAKPGFVKAVRWSSQVSNNVHVTLTGNDTVYSGTSATVFQLANVNGYSEFISLFDNYRITRVQYRWVCTRDPTQATAAGNKGIYPRINWTHDFNDQIPISKDLIYQRANMKEVYFTSDRQKSRWYTLKPSILAVMYESSTSSSYSPKWLQWIDTSDTAPHYGIKYAWDNLFAGVNVNLEAKIFLECKGIS